MAGMANENELFQFEGVFGRPHPLYIPSVVAEIMSYLNFGQLKTCRMVCKDWNQEAFKLLTGRSVVRITNYKRLKDFTYSFETRAKFCNAFELGRALNIESPLMLIFFEKYGEAIQSISLERTKWKKSQLSELLFNKLANLESLKLDCLLPGGNNEVGRFFQTSPPQQLPKLKHLHVDVHSWENSFELNPAARIKAFLLDLFAITPNLETVACPKSEGNYQPLELLFPMDPVHVNHFINGEVLDALDELNGMGFESNIRRVLFDTLVSQAANAPVLEKLTDLDVSITAREEHIRSLQLKSYPIQCLDVIITQNVTLFTLHGFLESLEGTLHSLTLRFLRRSQCIHGFPSAYRLKKLKTLKLTGYKGAFQFLQHFHNLCSLTLVKIPKLSTSFPAGEDFPKPLLKMEELQIVEVEKLTSRAFRPGIIHQWSINFPNLKSLRMDNICDFTLREIYARMPLLEELIALNGDFTDSGLSGLVDEMTQSWFERGYYGVPRRRVQPFLPISSLEHLKTLELGSKKLTDLGVIYGVTLCKKLRNLSILTYSVTDVSFKQIANVMQLDSLTTKFCNQLTVDLVKYLTMKMKGCEISINEYSGPMKSCEMWKFLKKHNNAKVTITRLPPPVPDNM